MLTLLRASGVDMFNVSSRRFYKPEWPESAHPDYTIAEWVSRMTDAPVMTCGSVGLNVEMFANLFDDQEPTELPIERDLKFAAERVRSGRSISWASGRTHIANNDFVAKVREGRFGELELFNKQTHLVEAMAAARARLRRGIAQERRRRLWLAISRWCRRDPRRAPGPFRSSRSSDR